MARHLGNGPEELGWAVASVTAPPEPFVPVEWQGRRVWAVAGQFAGPSDVAEKLMAPLRALGPVVDLFQPMPYTMVQTLIDGGEPVRAPELLARAQRRRHRRARRSTRCSSSPRR